MAYLTSSQLIEYMTKAVATRMTNDVIGATEPVMPIVDAAVAFADSVIDSHLRGRYALPLPTVPSIVTTCGLAIARKSVFERKSPADMPQGVTDAYDDAMNILKGIAAGTMILNVDQQDNTSPSEITTYVNKTQADRIFSRDILDMY